LEDRVNILCSNATQIALSQGTEDKHNAVKEHSELGTETKEFLSFAKILQNILDKNSFKKGDVDVKALFEEIAAAKNGKNGKKNHEAVVKGKNSKLPEALQKLLLELSNDGPKEKSVDMLSLSDGKAREKDKLGANAPKDVQAASLVFAHMPENIPVKTKQSTDAAIAVNTDAVPESENGPGKRSSALESSGFFDRPGKTEKNPPAKTILIQLSPERAGQFVEQASSKPKTDKNAGTKDAETGKNGRLSMTVVDKRNNSDRAVGSLKNSGDFLQQQLKQEGGDRRPNHEAPSIDKSNIQLSQNREESFTVRRDIQEPVTKQEQSQLLKQLKTMGNKEVVKQASVILKNNNSAEIRLNLKPDKMGNVRIRLHLQDNNIVGKIIVDNSSVKEVFEQNLESLYKGFRQEGFDTASLNVSVGDGQAGKRQREEGPKSFYSSGTEKVTLPGAVDGETLSYGGEEEGLVNLII
jgi:flagellar hook-length control protein FliK